MKEYICDDANLFNILDFLDIFFVTIQRVMLFGQTYSDVNPGLSIDLLQREYLCKVEELTHILKNLVSDMNITITK